MVVARVHSFSQAAVSLRLSQPALSRQIKSLEDELNTRLFERHRRELVLTTAGTYLYDQAQNLLADAQRIEANVPRHSEINSTIRIYCTESPATSTITRQLKHLIEIKPDVTITLTSDTVNPESLVSGLENNDYDFVVSTLQPNLTHFNHLDLDVDLNWSLLVPNGHPLAQKRMVEVKDIVNLPLLVPRSFKNTALDDWLKTSRSPLNFRGTFNLESSATSMVAAGLGVAFSNGTPLTNSAVISVPLSPQVRDRSALIWRKTDSLSQTAKTFLTFFKD